MTAHAHDRRTFLVAGTSAVVGLTLQPALGQSQDLAGLTLTKASELLRSKAVPAVNDLLVTPTMADPPSTTEPIEQSASLDPSRKAE